jgi:plasmid stabilization system protein ParE
MAEPSQGPGAPADAGTGGQAPQGTQPPATPPAQQQPTGQAPATQQPEGMTLEAAQKVIDDLRKENAKHRTDKQSSSQQAQAATDQLNAVLKALGKSPDGTDAPPDPAALAAEVTQQQAVAWETAAENAVLRVASLAGGNADLLLDSASFIDSVVSEDFIGLDPKSAEFRTKLQAHITVWVDKHPQHKAAAAVSTATRSGGDHPGGTGTPTTRPKSLTAAVSKHFGGK